MTDRRVWLAQCLCPLRHAIGATPGLASHEIEAQEGILEPLRRAVDERTAPEGDLNPWCGLCKAPKTTWIYEVKRTRWRTMEEAMTPLRELERRNRVTQLLWGEP